MIFSVNLLTFSSYSFTYLQCCEATRTLTHTRQTLFFVMSFCMVFPGAQPVLPRTPPSAWSVEARGVSPAECSRAACWCQFRGASDSLALGRFSVMLPGRNVKRSTSKFGVVRGFAVRISVYLMLTVGSTALYTWRSPAALCF